MTETTADTAMEAETTADTAMEAETTVVNTDPKAEEGKEVKEDGKPEVETEVKDNDKSEVKTDVKDDDKSEVKADVKDDDKSEVKTDVKDDDKSEVKTDVKDDDKSEVKTDVKDDDKSEVKTEVKEDDKSEELTTNGSAKADQPKTDVKNTENGSQVKEEILEEDIVHQIQYYFGNMNLPKDKFLQEQVKLDNGWVPIEVLTRFNRLAELSKDSKVIVKALKTQDKPFIEISEDETKIRRSPSYPLPEMNEEWRKVVAERTVYSKGFPPTGVSIGELIRFFTKFGAVDDVQKRTYFDRNNKTVVFKGSVFTTFDSQETAAKYVALEAVKWGDTELIRKFQKDYFEDKKKERDEKWGRKPKKDKRDNQEDQKKECPVFSCPRGCILHLAGFPTEDPIDRDVIRDKVTVAGGDVAFITYNRGDTEAFIRLQGDDENPAVKILETIPEKKLKIKEVELTARVLEGDEETEFLKKSLQDRDRRRGNSRRGRNNYRGKKRRNDGDGGPPRKSFKGGRD